MSEIQRGHSRGGSFLLCEVWDLSWETQRLGSARTAECCSYMWPLEPGDIHLVLLVIGSGLQECQWHRAGIYRLYELAWKVQFSSLPSLSCVRPSVTP